MQVTSLILTDYRNYSRFKMNFGPGVHFFYGKNGAGKTNLLEALYLASFGRSFRTRDERDIIIWDEKEAKIEVEFTRNQVSHRLRVILSGRSKRFSFNHHEVPRRDLIGELAVVIFMTDNLQLIKGPPLNRRHFIDSELSQASRSYLRSLLQYHRTLRQRNTLLWLERDRRGDGKELEPWDIQLAHFGAELIKARRDAILKISKEAGFLYEKIAGDNEKFSLKYLPFGQEDEGQGSKEKIKELLFNARKQDLERAFTSVGPHRDDIRFLLNNRDMRRFASQGQQRTGVLALKLGEIEYLYQEKGSYPILLLDDLLSELDNSIRQALLSHVGEKVQIFVTGTEKIDKLIAHFHPILKGVKNYEN